ncbi:MAG TPA: transketolase [Bacteroidetes bacterium]|nr:transketolase 2 [bacterium BMS3Bbin04]HDO64988.1 transketolase [Bacteroidota bacterium]HEX04113.1 transketolase [Bacteroidota bacterium]
MPVPDCHQKGRLELPADELRDVAKDVRRDILTMIANAGSGHTGGSLSACDFLTAILFHAAKIDPRNPKWNERDYWNVSNAHISPLIYSVMAERGYFPLNELLGFRQIKGNLQGHPSAHDTPGIEVSAGSLGQGLSVAIGVALASKMDKHPRRVFCCMGDGEQQEGSVWEAAMCAAHYHCDNITAIIDYNRVQIDGPVEEVIGIDPLADKWRAFNWHVLEIDGHDMEQIVDALAEADRLTERPTVILANTLMGKGWKEIEDDYRWHGRPVNPDEANTALQLMGTSYDEWLGRLKKPSS